MIKNEILSQVIAVAKSAGQTIMTYYQSDYKIENKNKDPKQAGGYDPLTIADTEANKIIINGLKDFSYGFLSEESDDDKDRLNHEKVWIIDPMDGTMDFIKKTDEFAVMIALAENGKPILGVVYNPPSDTVYYAYKGQGAYKQVANKEPIALQVSKINKNEQVRMLVSRYHLNKKEEDLFNKLSFQSKIPCGSAGLKICRIAEGKAELNINNSDKTKEWDVCAPEIILQEAGGRLSDTKGNDFIYNRSNPVNLSGYMASNGFIHDGVLNQNI